jgi:hypothetical protein
VKNSLVEEAYSSVIPSRPGLATMLCVGIENDSASDDTDPVRQVNSDMRKGRTGVSAQERGGNGDSEVTRGGLADPVHRPLGEGNEALEDRRRRGFRKDRAAKPDEARGCVL